MKEITRDWLTQHHACESGRTWYEAQKTHDPVSLLEALLADDKFPWANWGIVRVMPSQQSVAYAIYAAEQVFDCYEKVYPNDFRIRHAIEIARRYLVISIDGSPTTTKAISRSATRAAEAAAVAAEAAAQAAAQAATRAAEAAAWAAAQAAAGADAQDAAEAAARAASKDAKAPERHNAHRAMQQRLLDYGIKLLQGSLSSKDGGDATSCLS